MLPGDLRDAFVAALRRMLRPLVRQLVEYAIPYSAFDQLVRELYVDIAERDFALPYKRPTDSRIALVTGLNRKEIARLRGAAADRAAPAQAPATRVIGRWLAGPPFADRRGRPQPLPYEARPRAASFSALVRAVGIDAPVRSMLDELIHAGLVELARDGSAVLRKQANIPDGDPKAKLELLGSDPAEVFSTIVHNIDEADAPWLQRKVVYDNIGADALPALRSASREAGEEFIRRANALLAGEDRDRNPRAPGGRRSRVVLGVYYFEADAEAEAAPEPAPVQAEPPAGGQKKPAAPRRRTPKVARRRFRPRSTTRSTP